MELSVAKSLIQIGVNSSQPNQVWADLGAGDGFFTKALAHLLPPKSRITAVDIDERALRLISIPHEVELTTLAADLHHLPDTLPEFDGIMMANSLHYIKDQTDFLLHLGDKFLKRSGVVILVEYDLGRSNPWVPFPIGKKRLITLAEKTGFALEFNINTVTSKLNSSEIYCAFLKPRG